MWHDTHFDLATRQARARKVVEGHATHLESYAAALVSRGPCGSWQAEHAMRVSAVSQHLLLVNRYGWKRTFRTPRGPLVAICDHVRWQRPQSSDISSAPRPPSLDILAADGFPARTAVTCCS